MNSSQFSKRVRMPRLKLSRREKERQEWTEMINKIERLNPRLSPTGS
jgi:hypothetical protein